MADRLIHQPASPEFDLPLMRRRRVRLLAFLALALVVVLGFAAYTQTASFGQSLLDALNARGGDLKFAAESFRLVGVDSLKGSGIEVRDEDDEVVFSCSELNVGFDPIQWLQGSFHLRFVSVDGGQLRVIEGDRERSAIGSLWRVLASTRARTRVPLRGVEIRRIELADCAVQFEWIDRPEARIRISEIQATCQDFAPGQDASLDLSAATEFVSDGSTTLSMGSKGQLVFNLRDTGLPRSASGQIDFEFGDGSGRLSDWSGASGAFNVGLQSEQVDDISLRFQGQDRELGTIGVQGPFDSDKMEGRLRIRTGELRRPILNLLGVVAGVDFGESQLEADLTVDWAFGGAVVSMRGDVNGSDIELKKRGVTTPKTELMANYSFQYNEDDSSVLVQKFDVTAASGGSDWLTGNLGSPVILSWGDTRPGIKEPKFDFMLRDLDVQAWASFFLIDLPPGLLSMDAETTFLKDGQVILSKLGGGLRDLELPLPNGELAQVDLGFGFNVQVDDLERINILGLKYSVNEQGVDLLSGDGVASYSLEDQDVSLQLVALGPLKPFADRSALTGLDLSDGDLDVMLRVKSKDGAHDVILNVGLSELRGTFGPAVFDDHRFEWQLDTKVSGSNVQLNNLTVKARKGFSAAGQMGFNGNYDLESRSGNLRFQSVGINRNLFDQALEPVIDAKAFGDAELELQGTLELDLEGENRMTGTVGVSQWSGIVDSENEEKVTPPALDFEVQLQASYSDSGLDIDNGSLRLAASERAENVARFDLSIPRTSSGPGDTTRLRLRAEELDLERYWEWAQAVLTESAKTLPLSEAPSSPALEAERETDGRRTIDLSLNLGELYLGGLALTNIVSHAIIGPDVLAIDKLTATANGGDVQASLASSANPSNPELRDVSFDVRVDAVSVAGIPELFLSPDEPAFAGELDARLVINGQMAADDSPNSDLVGHLDLSLTGANYPFLNPQTLQWLRPVMAGLNLPALGAFRFDDLKAGLRVEKNRVFVDGLGVSGDLVTLTTDGEIVLDRGLSSEVDLPVEVRVRDLDFLNVGSNVGLESSQSDDDESGELLPSFLSVGGEVARPRLEIDQAVLTQWVLQLMRRTRG